MQNIKNVLKDGEQKTFCLKDITKNNSVVKKGLIIRTEASNLSPTIYLDDYFQEYYHKEMELEEVLLHIAKAYENSMPDSLNFDPRFLRKENVIGVLVNKERNQDFLHDVPYVEASADFAIYFKILLPEVEKGGMLTITVTRYLADNMNCSEDELLKLSLQNTAKLLPAEFVSMEEILFGNLEEADMEELGLPQSNMFALSNNKRLFGSFALFYPETLESIFNKLNSDIIILPSSIHEWIVLPYGDVLEMPLFEQTIQQVNNTELEATEILGDRPILLRRDGGDIFKQLTTNYAYSR